MPEWTRRDLCDRPPCGRSVAREICRARRHLGGFRRSRQENAPSAAALDRKPRKCRRRQPVGFPPAFSQQRGRGLPAAPYHPRPRVQFSRGLHCTAGRGKPPGCLGSGAGTQVAICAIAWRKNGVAYPESRCWARSLPRFRRSRGSPPPRESTQVAIRVTAWHKSGVAYPEKRLQPQCRARFPRSRDSPPPRAGTQVAICVTARHEYRVAYPRMRERDEESGQGQHLAALQPPLRWQAAMAKRRA